MLKKKKTRYLKLRNFVLLYVQGFPGGSDGKESACSEGDLGLIPGCGKIPWRRETLPTPVFWPGKFHGLYSPWGHKESDMTERLSLSLFINLFNHLLTCRPFPPLLHYKQFVSWIYIYICYLGEDRFIISIIVYSNLS